MSVEQQLADMKKQLQRVIDRLDALVQLEVKHDNTVEGLQRAHKRIDKTAEKVAELEKQVTSNSLMTRAIERVGWMVVSAGVGVIAYFFK